MENEWFFKRKVHHYPSRGLIRLIKCQPNSGIRCARLKWKYAMHYAPCMIFIIYRHDASTWKIWQKCMLKQTFQGFFGKILEVYLKNITPKMISIFGSIFTPIFYFKKSKLFSKSSLFGYYNIHYVSQNRFSNF